MRSTKSKNFLPALSARNCNVQKSIGKLFLNILLLSDFSGFDEKVTSLTRKVEAITGVYDDLHEKMHEMDKTKRNNLLFYGIKPDFLPGMDANSFHLYFNLVKLTRPGVQQKYSTNLIRKFTKSYDIDFASHVTSRRQKSQEC